jgi:methionyl-tRNA formyltransferase
MRRLRVVFMGTPDFATIALRAIADAGHEIVAAYTQPPRPAGRGAKTRPSSVHQAALALKVPVHCPTGLAEDAEIAAFKAHRADVVVVAAYGLILPRAILEFPPLGCINIHASLLPRWRGAAPIERAILAGDSETGVSIMRMDEGLDTGPILAERRVAIDKDMDAGRLRDRLARLGADMIVEILAGLPEGIEARPQASSSVTYATKLTKEEARLDWRKDAHQLERQVRAFHPRPGAFTFISGERIKVLLAEAEPGRKGHPGMTLDERLCVACGSGALRLKRLQRPGKSPMAADDFVRGFPVPAGSALE